MAKKPKQLDNTPDGIAIREVAALAKDIQEQNTESTSEDRALWFLHTLTEFYCDSLEKPSYDFIHSIAGDKPSLFITDDGHDAMGRMSKIDWSLVSPDIFGTAMQLCESDAGRSKAGMHYTSQEDILKVIDPLFMEYLEEDLEQAGDDKSKLTAILGKIAGMKIFDPACGSGNFLIISYRNLRDLEKKVLEKLGEDRETVLSLKQFYGIEFSKVPSLAAKISLMITAWRHGTDKVEEPNIVNGDSLTLDWTKVCPRPKDDSESVFIVGNPPFLGKGKRSPEQQAGMEKVFMPTIKKWKSLDYVASWFFKSANYIRGYKTAEAALVSTNSVCQGESVPTLWPHIIKDGVEIGFAYRSFKWRTHTASSAGVVCVIVGLRNKNIGKPKYLYEEEV